MVLYMTNTTAIAAAVEPLRVHAVQSAADHAAALADRSIAAYEADPESIQRVHRTPMSRNSAI